MIEMAFKEFYQSYGNWPIDGKGYSLYVMHNGSGDVLYIGISSDSIWNRWFGGRSHISVNKTEIGGKLNVSVTGIDLIGEKIIDHLPESGEWKIQLWDIKEAAEFCNSRIKAYPFVETDMINKLHSILNVRQNSHPGKDTTPESKAEKKRKKEAEETARRVFG